MQVLSLKRLTFWNLIKDMKVIKDAAQIHNHAFQINLIIIYEHINLLLITSLIDNNYKFKIFNF